MLIPLLVSSAQAEERRANCPAGVAGGVVRAEPGAGSGDVPKATDLSEPKLIARVPAAYPAEVKKRLKLAADVLLQGTVDIDGNVADPEVVMCGVTKGGVSLEPDERAPYCAAFSKAAGAAFSQWRFEPARRGGDPACVYYTARFKFAP